MRKRKLLCTLELMRSQSKRYSDQLKDINTLLESPDRELKLRDINLLIFQMWEDMILFGEDMDDAIRTVEKEWG